MSKSPKTEMVALKDLQVNLFVRKVLHQEHVLYLAELIENGVKLPPIKVAWLDGKLVVIDGRHRIEAHDVLGRTEIEVTIVEVVGETDLIAEAYRANVGGALPPSPQDTEHTVMLLLERGETTKKRIGELLGLPSGMARRYVTEVQSKLARSKIQRAVAAVTDGGLTVGKAAEQYDVDPEKLKETLSGSRRKHRQGIADTQRALTQLYRSVSQKNASALRRMVEKFDDGDVTEKQMTGIFDHIEKLQKQSARAVTEWRKRFEAKKQDHKTTQKAQQVA